MFNKSILAVAIAAMGCGFAGQALAGAASASGAKINMLVEQGAGTRWDLDLSGLMTFNAATGGLSFDAANFSSTSDSLGGWTATKVGTKFVDGVATQFEDGVKWNSWKRVDGSMGDATSTGLAANPWASVITFTASGNVDPFMTYGFTAKNNTASTQTYTFTMGETLLPAVAGAYDIHADVSGSILNGTGANVAITPALADQDGDTIAELQVLRLSNDNGLTFVNAGVDVGQADSYSGTGGHSYGVFNADKSASGSFNYWAIETKFTLTPGKDVASVAGFVEISPVPEPQPSTMLLAGIGMLGWIARRRLSAR